MPIAEMLRGFGVVDAAAQEVARATLVDGGLIANNRKVNIFAAKSAQARVLLQKSFQWHCNDGDCRIAAAKGKTSPLLVEKMACSFCGGSKDRAALAEMARAMADAKRRRVLVVGGTDNKEREIKEKSPPGIEWRFIDGTTGRPARHYRDHHVWADLVVIWGSTELNHKVSAHFDGKGDARTITVRRRGITALADEVIRHLRGS